MTVLDSEAEAVAKAGPKLRRPLASASLAQSQPVSEPVALAQEPLKTAAPPDEELPPTPNETPPADILPPPVVAPAPPVDQEKAHLDEIIMLGAVDYKFYCRHWFPKTFRQSFALFHDDMWRDLDDPGARYISMMVMRDGAKTTTVRAYISKRISYGLSRTILCLAASEGKAKNTVQWVKRQVQWNRGWTRAFGLRPNPKNWAGDRIEIIQELPGQDPYSIWVLGMGILGSTRGINIDDYRPDLILVDDVVSDDNAATPEQRDKIVNLVLGAVKESLSPASETPDAKLIILNTPLDFEDLVAQAARDPQFRSTEHGCWTKDTADLPVEHQESSWPERYPSEVLRSEKLAAMARNKLSIFAREKECRLITPETSAFRAEWLRYFGPGEGEPEPPLHETWVVLVIDPVPPPSDIQIAKGLQNKDFEAITAVGRCKGKYYVLETVYNRGHEPNWTAATIFELANRWKPRKIIVESVAYQRVLAWLLRKAMQQAGRYWPIEEFVDKRKKIDRIKQGLAGPAAEGGLYVRRTQVALVSQFIHYPGKNPEGSHDDVLETVAIGVESLSRGFVGETDDTMYMKWDEDAPALEYVRGCP